MLDVFATDVRGLDGREDELTQTLSAVRRDETLACKSRGNRLLRLGAGLLLKRNLGTSEILRMDGGKPYIPGGKPFSIAHSGDWAIVATGATDVGADIERVRAMREDAFANRWFTPDEREDIRRAIDPRTRFFEIWCMKESYMKLDGQGLTRMPDTFSVLRAPARFFVFADIPGYALAVCARSARAARLTIQTF